MDTSIPNDDERKKLQKLVKFYHHLPLYVLSLIGLSLIVKFVLDHFPIIGTAVTVLILAAMIYLLLNFALLKKCPRCSSWGTPILGGNCPKCGLRLDPSYNGQQNDAHNH